MSFKPLVRQQFIELMGAMPYDAATDVFQVSAGVDVQGSASLHKREQGRCCLATFYTSKAEVPEPYRSGCDVYTDEWDAYRGAVPPEIHFAVKKVWENKSHRGGKLYLAAEDQPSCEEVGGFLEKFCESHGSNSIFFVLLQSEDIR